MINFFETQCQTVLNDKLFGICDDKPSSPAYIEIDNPSIWIATVQNENEITLTFTALDNCIIFLKEDGNKAKRCDVMLFYEDTLFFIELKDVMTSSPNEGAYEQLEETIKQFIANHDISVFKKRKAYVCNRAKRKFQKIENETQQRFYQMYGFRLHVEGTIKIV